MAQDTADTKKNYPTLYFTCGQEYDIPDTGTATIKFRKVEDAENTRDPADPKYRYELEIQGIEIDGMDESDMSESGEPDEADVKGGIKNAMAAMMKKKMAKE